MRKHLIVIILMAISIICYFYYSIQKKNYCNSLFPSIVSGSETDSRFLVTSQKDIVYSNNNSGYYSLYKLSGNETSNLYFSHKNVQSPFLFKGEVVGLHDIDGDENFLFTSEYLNKYLDYKKVKAVFSFKNGYLLIIQFKHDSNVYLIDFARNVNIILLKEVQQLHNICFSEKYNFLIVNFDTTLSYINLSNNFQVLELASNFLGEKMNPFIFEREVYFSNNDHSEYFQIFKITLNHKFNRVSLVYKSSYDLRVPKFQNGNLFFIEIVNNEYLLRKLDLKSGKMHNINDHGVVYNYELLDNNTLVFAYSDFYTPKCLFKYNESNNSVRNLTGTTQKLELSYKLIDRTLDRSSAYVITPLNQSRIKGVILFFHPGLHSDFSPRWDNILMNLSNNGYIIVSPNYPMSSGFGKSYYNSTLSEAIVDMKKWKSYILNTYDNTNLFYLSSSSGNILMEFSLLDSKEDINASISLCGIPSGANAGTFIPSLYILGRNDSRIDYIARRKNLKETQGFNKSVTIITYGDEGHLLFSKTKNLKDAIIRILEFLCNNN